MNCKINYASIIKLLLVIAAIVSAFWEPQNAARTEGLVAAAVCSFLFLS